MPSIAERYAALARWSSSGVPSPRITTAASSTVCSVQGWPSSAASVANARIGVAATPPSPMRARVTTPSSMSSANPMATLEMSSARRLAILWNAVSPASGRGIRMALISSPGRRAVLR